MVNNMLTTEDIQTLKIDFYKLRNNKLGVQNTKIPFLIKVLETIKNVKRYFLSPLETKTNLKLTFKKEKLYIIKTIYFNILITLN